MIDPDAALTFLDFVSARHQIWERRQRGEEQPWTDDPILASAKFTNVFRVLDPGSQFVFELAEDEPEPRDLLMRLFLYRHTGRVEVWKHLREAWGQYPNVEDLDQALKTWKEYRRSGQPVFTGAYLVYPQSSTSGTDKLESIINLTKRLFDQSSEWSIVSDFMEAQTQATRFAILRMNKGVADFMSMQILTDWGYLNGGQEDEFVVCGPGAVKGAKELDPDQDARYTLEWVVYALRFMEGCPGIETHDNVFRLPSYMDVQNCLCEFSKYVRYQGKTIPDRVYQPAHPGPQPPPVLPTHW